MDEPLKCSDDHCDRDGVAYVSGPSLGASGRCTIIAGARGRLLWAKSHVLAHYMCSEHAEIYIGQWLAQAKALASDAGDLS